MIYGRIVKRSEIAGLIGHVFGVSPDGTITDYGTSDEILPEHLPFDGGRDLIGYSLPVVCRNAFDWRYDDDAPKPALPGKEPEPAAVRSLKRPTPIPRRKALLMAATEGVVCLSTMPERLA
jgi:hypothetical protein